MAFELLSLNTKLAKSIAKFDVITAGLALAPHRRSGFDVCPEAGFCSAVCNLWFSGRTVSQPVRNAMLRRATLLVHDRDAFMAALRRDLDRVLRKSERLGKPAYVRLNTSSDLDWIATIADYPTVRFYDYTKIRSRARAAARGHLPENYCVTPSYSERMHHSSFRSYLNAGLNVSVVFDTMYIPSHGRIGQLPKTFRGFPVVDGDTHDLRHPDFDGRGNVIGLRFKGSRRLMSEAVKRGFVIATG